MRHRKLTALAALAVIFAGAQPAHAASNLVDGSITAAGAVCSWTNGRTSANPPRTLTIDRASINPPGGNLRCGDGTAVTLNNSPTVTFNDSNATGTADAVDVSVSLIGITCRYRVSNAVFTRQGTTRDYVGGPYTASRVSGFLCPSTTTIDQARLSFR
ncbi:hypothetical protein [Micromonospora inyonensis]|uniref:Uncharacterized protein n=1 Tax=Micromonospora inyonensis TaxID=47866 RepID=A0A1C6SHM7_9ACTN|nr:hypothetical protein [Micromonospora inyonensis]SCL28981.1 hypothetical protein GA0074694_5263 [Micromonospora inyonensis]